MVTAAILTMLVPPASGRGEANAEADGDRSPDSTRVDRKEANRPTSRPSKEPESACWQVPALSYRATIRVRATETDHLPRAYVASLDLGQLKKTHALASIDPEAFVVVPVDQDPKEGITPLPSQFNALPVPGHDDKIPSKGELAFYCDRSIQEGDTEAFHVYFDTEGVRADLAKPAALVSVGDKEVMWPKGDPKPHLSLHLRNLVGEYYWHITGCSFASVIDTNQNDWVTWKSRGGWAGNYRGLPNSRGPYHPGYTKATSQVLFSGPVRVRIEANKGEFLWDIFPTCIRATRTRGKHNLWWYEGTPGGRVDARDTYLLSTGLEQSITRTFDGMLKDHWVVYKDAPTKAALFLLSHPGGLKTRIAGAKKTGPKTMLVTRFNLPKEPNPMHFALGLVYENDNARLRRAVRSIFCEPVVTVAASEAKPDGE